MEPVARVQQGRASAVARDPVPRRMPGARYCGGRHVAARAGHVRRAGCDRAADARLEDRGHRARPDHRDRDHADVPQRFEGSDRSDVHLPVACRRRGQCDGNRSRYAQDPRSDRAARESASALRRSGHGRSRCGVARTGAARRVHADRLGDSRARHGHGDFALRRDRALRGWHVGDGRAARRRTAVRPWHRERSADHGQWPQPRYRSRARFIARDASLDAGWWWRLRDRDRVRDRGREGHEPVARARAHDAALPDQGSQERSRSHRALAREGADPGLGRSGSRWHRVRGRADHGTRSGTTRRGIGAIRLRPRGDHARRW